MKHVAPVEARTKRGNLRYLETLRGLSRKNRKNPTEGEKTFRKLLSYKKLGLKFLRQKPVGKFIVDFYCSKLLLAIEIDGDSHDRKSYVDKERDRYFRQRRIKTIRYKNEEVLNDFERVRQELFEDIRQRQSALSLPDSKPILPSLEKGGLDRNHF